MPSVRCGELVPSLLPKSVGNCFALTVLGQRGERQEELSLPLGLVPLPRRKTQTLREFLAADIEPREVPQDLSGPPTQKARRHPEWGPNKYPPTWGPFRALYMEPAARCGGGDGVTLLLPCTLCLLLPREGRKEWPWEDLATVLPGPRAQTWPGRELAPTGAHGKR